MSERSAEDSATPLADVVGRLRSAPTGDVVTLAAVLVIVVTVALRGAASLSGWFYGDDFILLTEATGRALTPAYLLEPHDSQLMPGGRLAIWLVAQAGPFNWTVAALQLIVLQAIATGCCWLALQRLFGATWGSLGLLAFYAGSAASLTSFMWWASAINQLPFAIAFFLALWAHVGYLEKPSVRRLAITLTAVAFGLLFYVKAALILLVLALFTALFALPERPTLRERVTDAASRYRSLVVAFALLGGAYTWYYASRVPSPVETGSADYLGLMETLVYRSLGTTLVGGPWLWDNSNPPVAVVATPDLAITAAWAVIVGVMVVVALRRGLEWRALLLAGVYLATTVVLIAQGRAIVVGPSIGLELRYLADFVPVLTLCLGLMLLDSRWSRHRWRPSDHDRGRHRAAWCAGVVALVAGALVSSVTYVGHWQTYPTKEFVQTVAEQSAWGPLTIADHAVPAEVILPASFPHNLPRELFVPLGERVVARTEGNDLRTLGARGEVLPALVRRGARSRPGPVPDCGYRVELLPTDIPVTGSPPDFFWWVQMNYVANSDGTAVLSINDRDFTLSVLAGEHTYYLEGEGPVDRITLRASTPETVVCVDRLAVGPLEPWDHRE